MDLRVVFSVGAWGSRHEPFGVSVVRAMEQFDLSDLAFGRQSDAMTRWHHVYDEVFQGAVSMTASPQDTVSQFTSSALGLMPENALRHVPRRRDETPGVHLAHLDGRLIPDGTSTLEQGGVCDGDLLVLYAEFAPRRGCLMLPARDPAWLFQTLQLATGRPGRFSNPGIWGILLYTDADVELATYFRTHFDDMNALSGRILKIFVLERPVDWATARRYWRRHLDPEIYRVFSSLRWLGWKPHDRQEAYDIARTLGVDVAQLPCLVLFRDVATHPKVVFPISAVSPDYFRRLFGAVHAAVGERTNDDLSADELAATRSALLPVEARAFLQDRPGERDPDATAGADAAIRAVQALPVSSPEASGELFLRVVAAEKRILAALEPAKSAGGQESGHDPYALHGCTVILTAQDQPVTENFTFYGQTTFINRPTDTVITDFQNAYSSVTGRDELIELLTLVLGSRDLVEADKENAAQLIHQAAAQIAGPEADRGQVRKKLDTLKAILSRAADIASPALEIVSSILRLIAH
jgi:hypothetical protein